MNYQACFSPHQPILGLGLDVNLLEQTDDLMVRVSGWCGLAQCKKF